MANNRCTIPIDIATKICEITTKVRTCMHNSAAPLVTVLKVVVNANIEDFPCEPMPTDNLLQHLIHRTHTELVEYMDDTLVRLGDTIKDMYQLADLLVEPVDRTACKAAMAADIKGALAELQDASQSIRNLPAEITPHQLIEAVRPLYTCLTSCKHVRSQTSPSRTSAFAIKMN